MGNGLPTTDPQRDPTLDAEATLSASTDGRPIEAAPTPEPGGQFGRYVLLEQIGRGAMGQVFAAYDSELDRKVALKIVPTLNPTTEHSRREAQAMAKISHPNVVTVHDVGDFDGGFFIAMEYLPGGTLADRAGEGRSATEVLDDFLPAGQGLAAAHDAGLVHRDFKPANVLFDAAGRPKVADFGLAEPIAGSEGGSASAGTPAYMAPEQFAGRDVDARADQFAFCVALYEALAGHRPFAGETLAELATSVVSGQPLDLARARASVPVRRALRRGLAKDPADRFASMHALLDAIDERRRSRRRRQLGAGLVGIGAIVAAIVVTRPTPRSCDQGAPMIAEVWTPDAAGRLRDAIASKGTDSATRRAAEASKRLDDFAADWANAYDAACRRRADPPTPQDERERLCLLRSREVTRSLLAILDDGDAIDSADDLAQMLGEPSTCTREVAADDLDELVADASQIPAVLDVLAAVDRARLRRLVGEYAPAVSASADALTRARGLGLDHVVGTALVEHGAARLYAEEAEEGGALLREAFELGVATRNADLQAEAAGRLVQVFRHAEDYHECGRWYGIARAALQAIGGTERREIALAINYAKCLEAEDPAAAVTFLADTFDRCMAIEPRDDRICGDVAHNRGALAWRLRDFEVAVGFLDEAEGLWPDDLEAGDPRRIGIATRRTITAERNADYDTASRITVGMFETFRDTRGADHPDTLEKQLLAAIFTGLKGDVDTAQALLDDATTRVRRRESGPPGELTQVVWAANAVLAEIRGDLDQARPMYERTYDAATTAIERARALRGSLVLEMMAGNYDAADATYVAVVEEDHGPTIQDATCWWVLTAVLRGDPDVARARLALHVPTQWPSVPEAVVCRVASLATTETPDDAEVDALLGEVARVHAHEPRLRAAFARALGRE